MRRKITILEILFLILLIAGIWTLFSPNHDLKADASAIWTLLGDTARLIVLGK